MYKLYLQCAKSIELSGKHQSKVISNCLQHRRMDPLGSKIARFAWERSVIFCFSSCFHVCVFFLCVHFICTCSSECERKSLNFELKGFAITKTKAKSNNTNISQNCQFQYLNLNWKWIWNSVETWEIQCTRQIRAQNSNRSQRKSTRCSDSYSAWMTMRMVHRNNIREHIVSAIFFAVN